ncbi:MAG: hypothetical protein KAX19_11620, partial [Candidatus Brocadiae bacterium]|nr:hypothetical protein [Candidatus Brocadiia bacterium]
PTSPCGWQNRGPRPDVQVSGLVFFDHQIGGGHCAKRNRCAAGNRAQPQCAEGAGQPETRCHAFCGACEPALAPALWPRILRAHDHLAAGVGGSAV